MNNYVPLFLKPVFTLSWSRPAAALARWWARRHGVPALPLSWANTCGPLFGNTIATLRVDGRSAEVLFEQPRGPVVLDEVGRVGWTDFHAPGDATRKGGCSRRLQSTPLRRVLLHP